MIHQRTHVEPPAVDVRGWEVHADAIELDDRFVRRAARAGRHVPSPLYDAIADFGIAPPRAGALLLRGVPIGDIPATPPTPTSAVDKDATSELVLLTVAHLLGHPVGYLPEHGGRIVQNIVPTPTAATIQVSTSSRVELLFHTETAFHPHRPRYLLLLCLRGDPTAATTLASVHELVDRVDPATIDVLFQPRFRTAVDASFLGHDVAPASAPLGEPRPVLSGTLDEPTMVFDADLMIGTDPAAQRALEQLAAATAACNAAVVLEAGDLLVVDNNLAVHGRTPFVPRFDGTDRWLQRTFVVTDLAPSAHERTGRVITTDFTPASSAAIAHAASAS
jgi:L-asparagine oxygenase